LPSILPPMTLHEALETTKIHSVVGRIGTQKGLIAQRPFRSPHHTISNVKKYVVYFSYISSLIEIIC